MSVCNRIFRFMGYSHPMMARPPRLSRLPRADGFQGTVIAGDAALTLPDPARLAATSKSVNPACVLGWAPQHRIMLRNCTSEIFSAPDRYSA